MKILLASLLLQGFVWASDQVRANASNENEVIQAKTIVVVAAADADEDEEGSAKRMVLRALTPEGDQDAVITVTSAGHIVYASDKGGSAKARRMLVTTPETGKDRGWLGVWLGEVPEALAVQLDIEGRGLLITKVIDDTPARRAGLKMHDVLLEFEGSSVPGDVGTLAKLIGLHKPGDQISLTLLRSGRERTVTVELGERPGLGAVETFNFFPDAEIEEQIKTRAKILKRGEHGMWVVQEFNDPESLKELPIFATDLGTHSMKIVTSGDHSFKTVVKHDGTSIVITQGNDGEITVVRNEDGNETTETYANREELREADEEAWELINSAGREIKVELALDGLDGMLDRLGDLHHEFKFDVAVEEIDHAHDRLREAEEQIEETMKRIKVLCREHGKGGSQRAHDFLSGLLQEVKKDTDVIVLEEGEVVVAKPGYSFNVDVDGTISLQIRKGDTEVIQRFANEDDLAKRAPDLYEKFRDTMSVVRQ